MKKQLVALWFIAGLSTNPALADNKDVDTASSDIRDKVSQVIPSKSVSYLEWCAQNPEECKGLNTRTTHKVNPTNVELRDNSIPTINVKWNSNNVWWVIKLDWQTVYLWVENISWTDTLLKAEYKYVWDNFWTLITVKSWNWHKSVFVTWKYNWVDYSIKSTAWYLEKDYKWANIGQAFLWFEWEKKLNNNYAVWAHISVTNTKSKELPWTRSMTSTSSMTYNNTHTVTDTTDTYRWQEFEWDKKRVNAWVFGQHISDDMRNKTKVGISWNNWTDSWYHGNVNYSHITADWKTRIWTDLSTNKNVRFSVERIISKTWVTISAYLWEIAWNKVAWLWLNIPLEKAPNRFRHASPWLDNDVTHTTWAEEASSRLYWKEVTREEIKTKQIIEAVATEEVKNFNYTISGWIATFTFTARAGFAYYSVISGNDTLISWNSFTVDVSTSNRTIVWIYEKNPYDNSKSATTEITIDNNIPTTPTLIWSTTVTVWDSMNLTFNSTDPEWKPVTYRVVLWTIPAGTTFNSNGALSWSTTSVQNGSFQVVSNDGLLDSTPFTVNYSVEAVPVVVNTAPTSSNATFDMWWVDSTQTFNLTPYIWDAETPVWSLQINIVSSPTYLNLNLIWTSFSVTPIDWTWYSWNDSFTYKVVDWDWAESSVSTVTILNVSDI